MLCYAMPCHAVLCCAVLGGLGLFARAAVRPEQALGEYGGPRLPPGMARRGSLVLA